MLTLFSRIKNIHLHVSLIWAVFRFSLSQTLFLWVGPFCPSGPLTSSLSLTPVQPAAWSEQPQEQREEIIKKPLERSNVS